MSGGDKDDPIPFTLEETRSILRLPIVEREMLYPITVNAKDWDIPYLAGYSKDGDRIYIDRDLSDWEYGGKSVNTNRFLTLHEKVEKSLIHAIRSSTGHDRLVLLACLGMKSSGDEIYFHCHGVATCVELHSVYLACGRAGVTAYNRFMKSQVKRAEDERIRRVPKDLDMTPYGGSDEQDKRLRAAMKKAMVRPQGNKV